MQSQSRSRSLGPLNHICSKKLCLYNNNNNYYEINYESLETWKYLGWELWKFFFLLLLVPFTFFSGFIISLRGRFPAIAVLCLEVKQKSVFSSHLWLVVALLRIFRIFLPFTCWHTTREFLHVLPKRHVVVMFGK